MVHFYAAHQICMLQRLPLIQAPPSGAKGMQIQELDTKNKQGIFAESGENARGKINCCAQGNASSPIINPMRLFSFIKAHQQSEI
jgi:hypothetical protein